jgi:hypothetical protein
VQPLLPLPAPHDGDTRYASVFNHQDSAEATHAVHHCPQLLLTCNPQCARIRPLLLSDVRMQRPALHDLAQAVAEDVPP